MSNNSKPGGRAPETPAKDSPEKKPSGYYPTTLWDAVRRAAGEGEDSKPAATQLYERYKTPVLAQFRRYGFQEAEVLCNEFFGEVFFPKLVQQADEKLGRFRGLLGRVLYGYIVDEFRRRNHDPLHGAVEMDPEADGGPAQHEIQAGLDQHDASLVVGRAFARLREQYARKGEAELFEFCVGSKATMKVKEIAAALNQSVPMVKYLRLTARSKLRDLLLQEVSQIAREGEIEAEAKYLMGLYQA